MDNNATEVTGMGQVRDISTRRKWKQLQSWERSQIEALLKSRHIYRMTKKSARTGDRETQKERMEKALR